MGADIPPGSSPKSANRKDRRASRSRPIRRLVPTNRYDLEIIAIISTFLLVYKLTCTLAGTLASSGRHWPTESRESALKYAYRERSNAIRLRSALIR